MNQEPQNKNFTQEEMQKIIETAISRETSLGISFGVASLYKDLKNSNYSLIKSAMKAAFCSYISQGLFNSEKNAIVIFLGRCIIMQELGISHQLYLSLRTTYHEYFHYIQFNSDQHDNYHKAIYEIESIIAANKPIKYFNNHKSFLFEIEADKYGIQKAENHLQQNEEQCKGSYEDDKAFINWEKSRNDFNYNNYDLNFLLNILHIIVRKNPSFIKESFLETIYKNDGSFKKIADILQNPLFLALDERIQYHLIGNDTFLHNTDLTDISDEELNFINKALKYRLDLAIARRNINTASLKSDTITTKQWLKKDCSIVNYINGIYSLNMLSNRIAMENKLIKNKGIKNEIETITKDIDYVGEAKIRL